MTKNTPFGQYLIDADSRSIYVHILKSIPSADLLYLGRFYITNDSTTIEERSYQINELFTRHSAEDITYQIRYLQSGVTDAFQYLLSNHDHFRDHLTNAMSSLFSTAQHRLEIHQACARDSKNPIDSLLLQFHLSPTQTLKELPSLLPGLQRSDIKQLIEFIPTRLLFNLNGSELTEALLPVLEADEDVEKLIKSLLDIVAFSNWNEINDETSKIINMLFPKLKPIRKQIIAEAILQSFEVFYTNDDSEYPFLLLDMLDSIMPDLTSEHIQSFAHILLAELNKHNHADKILSVLEILLPKLDSNCIHQLTEFVLRFFNARESIPILRTTTKLLTQLDPKESSRFIDPIISKLGIKAHYIMHWSLQIINILLQRLNLNDHMQLKNPVLNLLVEMNTHKDYYGHQRLLFEIIGKILPILNTQHLIALLVTKINDKTLILSASDKKYLSDLLPELDQNLNTMLGKRHRESLDSEQMRFFSPASDAELPPKTSATTTFLKNSPSPT